jgi:hypothetical protein
MPMDPMAAGGGMPMDPMAAGGAPPMDPAMGGMPPGGMPPGGGMPPAGAMPPELQMMIDQAVQAAMQGQGANGAGGAPGAGGAGAKKLDPNMLYLEMGRMRKLMTNIHQHLKIPLPEDILDDNMVAQAVSGQPPQSPPIGQEAGGIPPGGPQPPGGAPGGLPGIGESPAINPITPIEPPKTAAADPISLLVGRPVDETGLPASGQLDRAANEMDAMAYLSRSLLQQQSR